MGREAHPRSGRPIQRSERGREDHTEVWAGSGGPPGGLGRVKSLTRRSERGRESHPEVWESHPEVR